MNDAVGPTDLIRLTFFAGLPGSVLERLAADAAWRSVADGEVIYTEGGAHEHLHWILDGQVVLRTTHRGRQVIVGTLGAGELVGWASLAEAGLSLTTARASGDCRLLSIPASTVLDVVSAGGEPARALVRRLLRVAAGHLAASRSQLLQLGHEGVISAG